MAQGQDSLLVVDDASGLFCSAEKPLAKQEAQLTQRKNQE
jgi:hypothetical protein